MITVESLEKQRTLLRKAASEMGELSVLSPDSVILVANALRGYGLMLREPGWKLLYLL